jgi:hypothetical protein
MGRPTDWYVLDLSSDPVPGEPEAVASVARTWSQIADDADTARGQIQSLLGDEAVMQWVGRAGDAFRQHSSKLPDQLAKCSDSYSQAASALRTWSAQLSSCQASADKALALGRQARADLQSAQAHLHSAQANAASAGSAASSLQHAADSAPASAPAPDPDQVRAAVARASAANSAVSSAQNAVGDAQARLDAAKKMAADAASLRDQHGSTTSKRLHDAADAGIPPDSFWSKLGDAISSAWHVVVEVAKVVVAVAGIVALIIGGPIAWIVFAAAVIVLADTLVKYAQGKASLLDVIMAAVTCIPCTKGLTTLEELSTAFRSGGLLGAGGHLLASGKNAAIGFTRTAQRLRVGGLAGARAVFTGLGDAMDASAAESGLGKITAYFSSLNSARSGAVDAQWATYVASVGAADPARAASLWQGHGSYPGVDAWRNETLAPGTRLEAGYPGVSGYVVPDGTAAALGHDAAAYNAGVQVGPNPDSFWGQPLRPDAIRFETTTPVDVASSTATANAQYGPGGLAQHYVPDFGGKVVAGHINAVDGAGHTIPAEINGGHLIFHPPSGGLIHLTNSTSLPPGIPTIQHVAATRPVISQTIPRVITEPWIADQAISH